MVWWRRSWQMSTAAQAIGFSWRPFLSVEQPLRLCYALENLADQCRPMGNVTVVTSNRLILGAGLVVLTVAISAIGSFFLLPTEKSWRGLWRHLLPPGVFTHPSPRTDLLMLIGSRLMRPAALLAGIVSVAQVGFVIHSGLVALGLPPTPAIAASSWFILAFTVMSVLGHDLSYYLYHRWQHANPLLWEFHKVHHSAELMAGVTDQRRHPVDDLGFLLFDAAFSGVIYGAWMCLIPSPTEMIIFGLSTSTLAGLVTFGLALHFPYALSFGWFDRIIVSPRCHHAHHSIDPKHYNTNFSISLMIWDWMFGTLYLPEPGESFQYGLANHEEVQYRSVISAYLLPFVKAVRLLMRRKAQELSV